MRAFTSTSVKARRSPIIKKMFVFKNADKVFLNKK